MSEKEVKIPEITLDVLYSEFKNITQVHWICSFCGRRLWHYSNKLTMALAIKHLKSFHHIKVKISEEESERWKLTEIENQVP